MASWTSIPDSSLDPDAPVTSELAYAWRDNPIAITEGASGAPRIQQAAMMDPTAGTTNTLKWLRNCDETAPSDRTTVLLGGTVTVTFALTVATGIVGFYRFRNGTESELFFKSSSGNYSEDISVQRGDVIYFQQKTAGGYDVTSIKFSSGANSMALA